MPLSIIRIAAYTIIYGLAGLSLLPLISWWAGLLALPIAGGLYYVLFYREHNLAAFKQINFWRLFRLSLFAVFFGVVVNLGCSVYSNVRVGQLYDECQEQKKNAFDLLESNKLSQNPKTEKNEKPKTKKE